MRPKAMADVYELFRPGPESGQKPALKRRYGPLDQRRAPGGVTMRKSDWRVYRLCLWSRLSTGLVESGAIPIRRSTNPRSPDRRTLAVSLAARSGQRQHHFLGRESLAMITTKFARAAWPTTAVSNNPMRVHLAPSIPRPGESSLDLLKIFGNGAVIVCGGGRRAAEGNPLWC